MGISVRPKQEFSLSAETEYSAANNHRIFGFGFWPNIRPNIRPKGSAETTFGRTLMGIIPDSDANKKLAELFIRNLVKLVNEFSKIGESRPRSLQLLRYF
jgi:hypothetical protein